MGDIDRLADVTEGVQSGHVFVDVGVVALGLLVPVGG